MPEGNYIKKKNMHRLSSSKAERSKLHGRSRHAKAEAREVNARPGADVEARQAEEKILLQEIHNHWERVG